MKINEIIRRRRQALGLTQEQVADRLGVSAPAVNKWERAVSYPDITLLPALARLLGTDLNTLLSFREDLTRQEIGAFADAVTEAARTQGTAAAFELAREQLREFPSCDLLTCTLACVLEGAAALWPDGEDRSAEILALYERCAHSDDPEVRRSACQMLFGRAVAAGELDRAEELLSSLPAWNRNRPGMEATLRRKQGRTGEAWTILERELMGQAAEIQTTLLSLVELAMEEGDGETARALAQTAVDVGRTLELEDYAVANAPLQIALTEQDAPAAVALLEKMFQSLERPWAVSASPLYRHIPKKEGESEMGAMLVHSIVEQMERDPACAFLRDDPAYRALAERYGAGAT